MATSAPERNFVCKHRGCGKAFLRTEHLVRHQLNRAFQARWLNEIKNLADGLQINLIACSHAKIVTSSSSDQICSKDTSAAMSGACGCVTQVV